MNYFLILFKLKLEWNKKSSIKDTIYIKSKISINFF
jgi:hypothetical protein